MSSESGQNRPGSDSQTANEATDTSAIGQSVEDANGASTTTPEAHRDDHEEHIEMGDLELQKANAEDFVPVNLEPNAEASISDCTSGKINAASVDQLINDEPSGSLHGQEKLAKRPNLYMRLRSLIGKFLRRYRRILVLILKSLLGILLHAYLVGALYYNRTQKSDEPLGFCNGFGMLIILTALAYWSLLYYHVLRPGVGNLVERRAAQTILWRIRQLSQISLLQGVLVLLAIASLCLFLLLDTTEDRSRLVSLSGVVFLLLGGWLFSKHPDKVIWRHIIWGLAIQISFALIILRWEVGRSVFECMGTKMKVFLDYTTYGTKFVFGKLSDGSNDNFILAIQVLPVIIFFNFVIQMIYYYGAMQWMLTRLGWLLQISVGTTACESLNAAANIFIGQTEAPLLVRPFLPLLTNSELHAVMTGGFATIAGSVMAAYIQIGVTPAHLLSASVMAAPAALAISKLVYPETEKSRTNANEINISIGEHANVLDAASYGAMSVVKLCGYIAASLIAFIAFINFIDGLVIWLGSLIGWETSFHKLISFVFQPLALLMGVPWRDRVKVAELLAKKIVINEFVAYTAMTDMIKNNQLTQRAATISTYALCGFANVSSIGIQISGISALAPERKSDLARLAVRAMIAGNVVCFLNASVAGLLIDASSVEQATINSTTLSPLNSTTVAP